MFPNHMAVWFCIHYSLGPNQEVQQPTLNQGGLAAVWLETALELFRLDWWLPILLIFSYGAQLCLWQNPRQQIQPFGVLDGQDSNRKWTIFELGKCSKLTKTTGNGPWIMFQDGNSSLYGVKNGLESRMAGIFMDFLPWKMFQADKMTGNGVPDVLYLKFFGANTGVSHSRLTVFSS